MRMIQMQSIKCAIDGYYPTEHDMEHENMDQMMPSLPIDQEDDLFEQLLTRHPCRRQKNKNRH